MIGVDAQLRVWIHSEIFEDSVPFDYDRLLICMLPRVLIQHFLAEESVIFSVSTNRIVLLSCTDTITTGNGQSISYLLVTWKLFLRLL